MGNNIDLTKKVEQVTISLAKKGIHQVPTLRVGASYDISGSMIPHYESGTVQKVSDQVLAVGMKFDDDGQVDTFVFDNRSTYIGTQTEGDYGTYVRKNILSRNDLWGSTNYGRNLEQVVKHFFGGGVAPAVASTAKGIFSGLFGGAAKRAAAAATATPAASSDDPVMLLFFTDGSPDDDRTDAAERVIRECEQQGRPIYFNLIGIGRANFRYLQMLADKYDNCGFVNMSSPNMTDAALYDALLGTDEFIAFCKQHGAK